MIDEFVRLLGSYPVGETDRKWFVMWIRRYQQFGRYAPDVQFEVDRSKTLAFCRELLGNGTPAWQRLQAVRCLIAYRALVLEQSDDLLDDIRGKLADLAASENASGSSSADADLPEPSVEEGRVIVGEPDYLTEFRRTMRRRRLKFATEKAYAAWLVRFACWAKVDDPTSLGEPEIREFLTEVTIGNSPGVASEGGQGNAGGQTGREVVAKFGSSTRSSKSLSQEYDVEWDVPEGELPMHSESGCEASTQTQAKSALLYFFQTHLGRELGFIDS